MNYNDLSDKKAFASKCYQMQANAKFAKQKKQMQALMIMIMIM